MAELGGTVTAGPVGGPEAEREAAALIRALLDRHASGVLSTLAADRDGHPFGSGVSFALDDDGAPLLLLSELAVHTKNLRRDPRASLFVTDDGPDAQAATRVSLLGRAAPLAAAGDAAGAARAAYLRRFPDAEVTLGLGGFALWRLEVAEARWIQGFGRMGWLPAAALHTQRGG
jgi:heme iron utilization protein